jgi:alpha-ketoglutarate-dependent taurine dioxygenase
MENTNAIRSGSKRLPAGKRNAIDLSSPELVKTEHFAAGGKLPLVVVPKIEGVGLALWLKRNGDRVEKMLLDHGGVLFRGFGVDDREGFEQIVTSIDMRRLSYMEGATPRTELGNKVYTSTEYPAKESIALHNELSYVVTWPMNICFFCERPAEQGGETPIADVRNVYQRLSPRITDRFAKHGWMLSRNFGDGLSLPWQVAFHINDKSEMERYCRDAQIDFEWKSADQLRTHQVRPAIAKHPQTGEFVWFNHIAFWHVSSLAPEVREAMRSVFGGQDLPFNTYYGDGSEIEDSIVEEIREAYRQETVTFPWSKGDLLLLDNMLVAHGRSPFTGPRRILVAMGNPNSVRGV